MGLDALNPLEVKAGMDPVALKRHLEAWGKPGEAFPVMRRMKAEYDPRGFLNPGRFLGGI